ncbi:MAG: hypothetical protein SF097_01420 [Acidobacteriota bacterium]|nr:hypothetical protein [Acidobacteriota bacterium]
MKRFTFALFLALMLSSICLAQVRVLPGAVKETRRTDGFFNRLEIEMRLIGDMLDQAKGVRVLVAKAIDDTGKNLVDEEKRQSDFKEFDSDGQNMKVDLELKNAARRAEIVAEISGMLEIFTPQKDPRSMVVLPGILKNTGKALLNPSLKVSGLEIIVWTKEEYEVRRKAEEEKIKKEFEERRKKASKEEQAELGDALADGLMKVFGGLFGALTEIGENGIAMQINDPQSKLISIEFETADGKPIKRQGRMTLGSQPQTQIFEFAEKLPANARIKIYQLTPKSLTKIPFKVTNVPLP